MLKRESRYSFKKGMPRNFFATPFFSLRYEKNDNLGPKVAVVVSKRIDNRATVRNKARRRFTEQLKEVLEDSLSYNLVFSLKVKILAEEVENMKKEIEQALKSLK